MAERAGSASKSQQSRQSESAYPTTRSQPASSMQSTYPYSTSSGQGPDPYRTAQPGPYVSSLPLINLPPIRSIDVQPPETTPVVGPSQYQPQLPPEASPSLPMLPAQQYQHPATMTAYYPAQAPQPPMISSSAHRLSFGAPAQPPNALYRLPLQASDQRVMSGGRHKKEIKRRTKTGCLTCRKRRIKCDETHPACRNCQKSKRECLGYDPIFKSQSSPAQLQPAPGPSSKGESSTAPALKSTPQHSSTPQDYSASTSQSYAQSQQSRIPPISYDFGLAPNQSSHTSTASMPHSQAAQEGPIHPRDHRHQSSYDTAYPRKRVRITDLLDIDGQATQMYDATASPLPEANVDEIRLIYTRDYAPGLDKILETDWYSRRSWPELAQNQKLLRSFDQLLQRFRSIRSDDFAGNQMTRSVETRLVWELLCQVYSVQADAADPDGAHQLQEARARLDALEALLTGDALARNPVLDVRYDYQLHNAKQWQNEFWRLLGQCVAPALSAPGGDAHATPQPPVEDTLSACRNILAMLENRDVLYSVMVCRFYGPQLPDWPDGVREAHNNDPNDMRTRVFIAKKFIEDEANGRGTNQVIQRVCDMAIRAWQVTR